MLDTVKLGDKVNFRAAVLGSGIVLTEIQVAKCRAAAFAPREPRRVGEGVRLLAFVEASYNQSRCNSLTCVAQPNATLPPNLTRGNSHEFKNAQINPLDAGRFSRRTLSRVDSAGANRFAYGLIRERADGQDAERR